MLFSTINVLYCIFNLQANVNELEKAPDVYIANMFILLPVLRPMRYSKTLFRSNKINLNFSLAGYRVLYSQPG